MCITLLSTGGAIMITLRLEPNVEEQICNTAVKLGISKSELVRKSITNYLETLSSPNPWELGKDYFGRFSSGNCNLSADRKVLIKERLRARRK